ncbi:MAG TPA: hypothetical protein VHY79_10210 [Rhizomicrobium sp.]|jgi:hypothetical protein|nr:hypothetical protein [Rhizomicrobium sp.]
MSAMAAETEMWEALFDHWRGLIAELSEERASYENGASAGKRLYKGEWEDITQFRKEQIGREITSLENALKAHGQSP